MRSKGMNGEDRSKGQDKVVQWEELDLVIHNMDSVTGEREVENILKSMIGRGIETARIMDEGVWLRYDPARITKETICQTLHQSGFRAGVFQDSYSGKTGIAS
jgi:hypothetical protein